MRCEIGVFNSRGCCGCNLDGVVTSPRLYLCTAGKTLCSLDKFVKACFADLRARVIMIRERDMYDIFETQN